MEYYRHTPWDRRIWQSIVNIQAPMTDLNVKVTSPAARAMMASTIASSRLLIRRRDMQVSSILHPVTPTKSGDVPTRRAIFPLDGR
jgi:hypothetical protein